MWSWTAARWQLVVAATLAFLLVVSAGVWWAVQFGPSLREDAVDCSVLEAETFDLGAPLAQACGEDVEIASERTPWETSWALAEGGGRLEISTVPEQVEVDGEWVPLDGTIVGEPGAEALSVAAPIYPMSFNPGGVAGLGQPLGSIERDGKTLDVWFPLELPEPTIDGSQVVYELGEGIRLFVSVNVDASGFLPVVELSDPAAAEVFAQMLDEARGGPADSERLLLEFETAVSAGLGPILDEGNAVQFVDEAGESHFMALPPIMWDSSAGEALVSESATEVAPTDRTRSPAGGDRIAEMGIALEGDTIVVEPDSEMLSSAETVWPVYIDPGYAPRTPHEWVAVRTGGYTTTLYKWGDISTSMRGQGTGNCTQVSSCNVSFKQRLAWEFSGLSLLPSIPSSDISSATFSVFGWHSYNCTAQTTTLYRTSSISTSSNWSNVSLLAPAGYRTEAHSETCKNRGFKDYNALVPVRWAADQDATQLTLGLVVNETSMAYWKRFGADATLEIEWNRAPNVPTGHQLTEPIVPGCVTGAERPVIADATPDLSVISSDLDGQNVSTSFEVVTASNMTDVRWSAANLPAQTSGSRISATVTSDLVDGGIYAWRARAYDSAKYSAWSGWCEFSVDTSPPAGPSVVPEAEGALAIYEESATRGGAGLLGNFRIDRGSATDVVTFKYGFNDDTMPRQATPGPDGTAVIPFENPQPGPVSLYVQSLDAAENFSSTTVYAFTVATATEDGIWMLDEGEGTTAADTVGSGDRPLTVSGAEWVDGPHALFDSRDGDRALQFDGVTDVATTDGPVVDTNDSFAISAHVWLDGAGLTSTRTALSQDGVTTSGFRLEYRPSCPSQPSGCWAFSMPDASSGTAETTAYSPVSPTADEWTHLVAEYDKIAQTVEIYVCEIGTPQEPAAGDPKVSVEGRGSTPWSAAGAFVLGRGLTAGQPSVWWSGRIDNVRVFEGEILAPAKIRRLCQGAEATDFGGDNSALDPTEAEQ
jgi:hypothetical protein